MTSSSKTARDPFLSFLYSGAAADERENVQPDSSSEASIEVHSGQADDSVLERYDEYHYQICVIAHSSRIFIFFWKKLKIVLIE